MLEMSIKCIAVRFAFIMSPAYSDGSPTVRLTDIPCTENDVKDNRFWFGW